MKKVTILLLALSMPVALLAQDKMTFPKRLAQKNILNHMDIGVNVGTVGIGIDLAVPVTNYVRIRAGYNYMPRVTINSDFSVKTQSGEGVSDFLKKFANATSQQELIAKIEKKLEDYQIDISDPKYSKTKALFDYYNSMTPAEQSQLSAKDEVTAGLRPNLHQFKLLVDVMPFKNNKHWTFTAGIFVGPTVVGDACNKEKETISLKTISAYNELYLLSCRGELPNGNHITTLENSGVAGFNLGNFKDGDMAFMVPDANDEARAEMEVNKVRPYVGIGYNTNLSRNKRWKLNVDAGVLFIGKPHIYVNNVYKIDNSNINRDEWKWDIVRFDEEKEEFITDKPLQKVDLTTDLDTSSIPGKVGSMTRFISKFKVYPNISVGVSYRLF
jgi:hypothetical protein